MTQSMEDAAKPQAELPERIKDAIPTNKSSVFDILNFMHHRPEYEVSVVDDTILHPFHKRYHAKPQIFNVVLPNLHLCRFKTDSKDLEFLEIQNNGLTVSALVVDGNRQYTFKSVLEAETYIADQLSD